MADDDDLPGGDDDAMDDDWAAALAEQGSGGGSEDPALADEWGAALAEQGSAAAASDMAAEWATMIDESTDDDSPDMAGADRILNQDEIDQLLGFSLHELSASGAGGIRSSAPRSGVMEIGRAGSAKAPPSAGSGARPTA